MTVSGYTAVSLMPRHQKTWRVLYRAYADFYQTVITDDMLTLVWSWLMDTQCELRGLAAQKGDDITAIAHWRLHIRPLSAQKSAYLDDVFVNPEMRRAGLGRLLINEAANRAKSEGGALLRWATAKDNTTAQMLYDKIARRTDWLIYDMNLNP